MTISTLSDILGDQPREMPRAKQTEAGVDWLTITVKEPDVRKRLFRAFSDTKDEALDFGGVVRPWSFLGYAGASIGGLRWGTRDDSDITMLSGDNAQRYWRLFAPLAQHCSRLDLMCTATLYHAWPGLAALYYKWHDDGNGQPDVKNLGYSVVQDTRGGQTCYVGSRKSAQFGRIYDKGVEEGIEGAEGMLWRYEVEYKKPLAWAALTALLDHRPGCGVHVAITDTVYRWFSMRDCPPVWADGTTCLQIEAQARVSGFDASLWWLSTQVSPTVKRLVDAGRKLETVKALGLYEMGVNSEA